MNISPANSSLLTVRAKSENESESEVIYLKAREGSSIEMACEIESNPLVDNMNWVYTSRPYLLDSNSSSSSNSTQQFQSLEKRIKHVASHVHNERIKHYTQIGLSNVSHEHTGFYTCQVAYHLHDSLNRTRSGIKNVTYFLQVHCKLNTQKLHKR